VEYSQILIDTILENVKRAFPLSRDATDIMPQIDSVVIKYPVTVYDLADEIENAFSVFCTLRLAGYLNLPSFSEYIDAVGRKKQRGL